MKKLFLTAALLIGMIVASQAQITIKGITLGSHGKQNYKVTSVAGVKGALFPYYVNDQCYKILFVVSDDGRTANRIYSYEAKRVISSFEKKFGLKFDKYYRGVDGDETDYFLMTVKNGVRYYISYEENEYLSPSVDFSFVVSNERLEKIANKIQDEKASSDF